ITFEDLLDYYG
nr:Chain T, INHIBITOR OF CAPSID ASSEMBLY [synthetic construct]